MTRWLPALLRPPESSPRLASEERVQRARIFYGVACWVMGLVTAFLLMLVAVQPETAVRRLTSIGVIVGAGLVLLEVNRRGRTTTASWLFILCLTVLVSQRAWTAGGISAPASMLFVIMVLLAGQLAGARGAAASAAAFCGLGLLMALAQQAGLMPPSELVFSPLTVWMYYSLCLCLAIVLQHHVESALSRSLRRADAEIAAQRRVEAERQRILHDLGERVKEVRLLHAAAHLMQRDRPADVALFQALVDLVPAAWQYPECCAARLRFRDVDVQTRDWRATDWRQSVDFIADGDAGCIDVVYLEQRPPADEGPFLAEERAVLESLVEMLVRYLELRRRQERLEELVTTRTQELLQAKEEAERANRAKGTFLATMSHEIRTPLHAMLGYAQLLQKDASIGPEQRERIGTILASGDHLLGLLNNVLEMSRIESGRVPLACATFDLRELLDSCRRMFMPLAEAKRLELGVEIAHDVPQVVSGDAGRVRQIVINLLGNALKFTHTGGVALVVAAAHADAALRITVRDTGIGIEPTDLERIFDSFEQAAAGRRGGGVGLGLSISRELARLMGGRLYVASTLGAGSAFTLELPLHDSLPAGALPPPAAAAALAASVVVAAPAVAAPVDLAGLLRDVPAELRTRLRSATLEARAHRIAALADEIGSTSDAAAHAIRDLLRDYRYDALLQGIDAAAE